MKNLFTQIIFGRDKRLSGLFALAFVGAVALGCTCGKNFDFANAGKDNSPGNSSNPTSDSPFSDKDSDGSIPSQPALQAMVKETTADFADAINTGDFSEIYSKASTDFQNTYSKDQMKNVFKTFTDNKSRVLPSLNKAASTEAEFTTPPGIRTEQGLSILMVNGKFPTKPLPVKFEYEYVLRGGEWKMLKLVVKM
jgi:hypothetical protein